MPKSSTKEGTPKKIGRPSKFSQKIANAICDRMAMGESLRSICKDDDMPSAMTVIRWQRKNKEFRDQVRQAREVQAEMLFDDALDLGKQAKAAAARIEDPRRANALVSVYKLEIDAIYRRIGVTRPKKFGRGAGEDNDKPNEHHDIANLTNEQIEAELALLERDAQRELER